MESGSLSSNYSASSGPYFLSTLRTTAAAVSGGISPWRGISANERVVLTNYFPPPSAFSLFGQSLSGRGPSAIQTVKISSQRMELPSFVVIHCGHCKLPENLISGRCERNKIRGQEEGRRRRFLRSLWTLTSPRRSWLLIARQNNGLFIDPVHGSLTTTETDWPTFRREQMRMEGLGWQSFCLIVSVLMHVECCIVGGWLGGMGRSDYEGCKFSEMGGFLYLLAGICE